MVQSVAIVVTKPPYGHEHVYGAFYTALAAREVDLNITLVLIGDGVYSAQKRQMSEANIGYPSIENLFDSLTSAAKILVEKRSLEERKILKENLIHSVKVVDGKKIFEFLSQKQAILAY